MRWTVWLIFVLLGCTQPIERDQRLWGLSRVAATPFQEAQFTFGPLTLTLPAGTLTADYVAEMRKMPDAFGSSLRSRLITMPVEFCLKINETVVDRQSLAAALTVSLQTSAPRQAAGYYLAVLSQDSEGVGSTYLVSLTDYGEVHAENPGDRLVVSLRESCATVAILYDDQQDPSDVVGVVDPFYPLPAAPGEFTAVRQDNDVTLTWQTEDEATSGFVLAYQEGEAPAHCREGTVVEADTIGEARQWTLQDLAYGAAFGFRLCAINQRVKPDYSDGVTATITIPADVDARLGAWENMSGDQAPMPRAKHIAAWTGTQMLIWGGVGSDGSYRSDGGRYDPATNQWTSMATTGAPAGRVDAAQAWLDNYWVIWGGRDSSGNALADGAYYEPATDTWTATSSSNAPTARFSMASGAGNNLLQVWGGSSGASYTNDYFTYDKTQGWTNLSAVTGAPTARGFATGLWHGSKWVVWGGAAATSYPNDGGQYSGNSWTTTLQAGGVLTGRVGHSMRSTGLDILIWGGASHSGGSGVNQVDAPDTLYNDGAIVNPVANTWTAMSTVEAPSPRYGHSAVWDGSGLIVWGGKTSVTENSNAQDGGRFHPSQEGGNWYHMATPSLTARAYHTAVWTGEVMIVWGGQGESVLGDGAIFRP